MLVLILLGSFLTSTLSFEVPVSISNHWNQGFQGTACIPFTQDVSSWRVHLRFSMPINSLEAYTAKVVSHSADNKDFVLENKPYNGNEHTGDKLCLSFQAHTSADIQPQITLIVNHMPSPASLPSTRPPDSTQSTQPQSHTTVTYPPGFTGSTLSSNIHAPSKAPGGGETDRANLIVHNDWGDRFEGEFKFPLTQDVEGWEAIIHFNMPITKLDLQHAKVYKQSSDHKTWTIVSSKDGLFYTKGTTLSLRFYGNHQGSGKLSGTGIFYNLGIDKNGYPKLNNTDGSKYNYDDVLYKSILFYEAQRSGKLPASNRIPWRGDSALGDKGDAGQDLTGGWYDAGDHVKFNFPMAYSTTILTWSLIKWKDAYQSSGQLHFMYDCIRWPLEYLLKCHTGPEELYVQVGNGAADHTFWGRPEDMTMARPAFKVDPSHHGSDVAGETAAAMAAGSMAFKDEDPAFSRKLLSHAKTIYKFAMKYKGRYSASVSAAAPYYPSHSNTDEHAWAGLWMYMATNESKYLTEALTFYQNGSSWGMSWDDKQAANQVLFYKLVGGDKYRWDVEDTFQHYWFPGQKIHYTPKGLAWRLQWGSLRYSSNMALVALMAAEEGLHSAEYRKWAMSQIHYALGDTGFSYLIGFGNHDYPHSPHHRSSSCPWSPSPCGPFVMSTSRKNVHTLFGALVGGPDDHDGYTDSRSNYVNNEVACDYNAGFQAAVAGLKSLFLRHLHPEQTSST